MAQQPPGARNAPHSGESRQRAEAALTRKFNEYKLETEFHDDHVVHRTHGWELSTRLWEESTWVREKVVGTGAFGSVWLHRKKEERGEQGGQLRAVKILPRNHLPTAHLSQEVLALIKLKDYDHLFVKFLGWYENVDNIFLTMEYIEYGDLSKYILQEVKSQICVKEITRQILEGLEVLHEKDIFHRDLKPQNILIASLDPIWVKITDFGIAKRAKGTIVRTACGTEGYIAPELQGLLPRNFSARMLLGSALDIWSLGSLLHELLTCQTPFASSYEDPDPDPDPDSDSDSDSDSETDVQLQLGCDVELLKNYCHGNIQFPVRRLLESQVDEEGIAFVKSLLAPNPKERPTATNTLKSPWLKGYTSCWFEELRDEFSHLGVNLGAKVIWMRQAYREDILRFLPKVDVQSLLLEATKKGYSLAVSKILESPSRESIDIVTMRRLFQVATEAEKHGVIKVLLFKKFDFDPCIDSHAVIKWAVSAGRKWAELLLEEWTNTTTSIDYNKIFLEAIISGDADVTKLFVGRFGICNLALQTAAKHRHINIIKLLLDNKADVDGNDPNGRTPLWMAAKSGHADIVNILLENKADVNKEGPDGKTPLQVAVEGRNIDTINLLLANEADVNKEGSGGKTPLQVAVEGRHIDTINHLLENKADVDKEGSGGETPLQWAARGGHIDIVKLLLVNKADVNKKGLDGKTPLHVAFEGGHIDIINLLMENKADVDEEGPGGETLLQWAAGYGHIDIIKFLLVNNADMNKGGSDGKTPLHVAFEGWHIDINYILDNMADVDKEGSGGETLLQWAARYGYTDIVNLLLVNRANVNKEGSDGKTPLHVAVEGGHIDIINLLLKNKADVDEERPDGETPLQWAARGGHIDIVNLLLVNKADVNQKGFNGKTPLHAAFEGRHIDIINLLLENKADVDRKGPGGETLLQWAARGGHIDIAKFLLVNKADVNKKGFNGKTPLHAAVEGGHIDIINLLLENKAEVDQERPEGETPLQWAARGGHIDIVNLLLVNEADVNKKGPGGRTFLQWAARGGYIETVKLLLHKKVNVNVKRSIYQTALQEAVSGRHIDIVTLLLDYKADVNARAFGGGTALQAAAENGDFDIVKLLLENKADVNALPAWPNHLTALQAAVEGGHTKIVKLLLDFEADVDAPPILPNRLTATQAALKGGNFEIFKLLSDNNPSTVGGGDRAALRAVANDIYIDTSKLVSKNGAGVNAYSPFPELYPALDTSKNLKFKQSLQDANTFVSKKGRQRYKMVRLKNSLLMFDILY